MYIEGRKGGCRYAWVNCIEIDVVFDGFGAVGRLTPHRDLGSFGRIGIHDTPKVLVQDRGVIRGL